METFAEHYQSMMDTIQRCMPGADLEIIDRAVRVVVAERFLSESAGVSSGSHAPETNRPSTN